MSLIHTVHTMNTNILPILLIVTMQKTQTQTRLANLMKVLKEDKCQN